MTDADQLFQFPPHDHVFLGKDHERAERRTWAVIILCSVMMIAEIIGGALFGSLALIADGLHMSTHAGALLLAALAYTYARKYANDRSFSFGTGKFGDLAGYSSAIVLAMIALLIGYEAVSRLLNPVAISFNEAIPIAVLGLVVNVASAWLLSGGHHHGHSHGHAHGHDHGERTPSHRAGRPDRWKSRCSRTMCRRASASRRRPASLAASDFTIETIEAGRQPPAFYASRTADGYLESRDEIPEPHAFLAKVRLMQAGQAHERELEFEEHDHEHGAWRASPRQQYAGRRHSCHGRCRRIGSGHCRPAAGARVRLALDGPAGRLHRRDRHRQLVGRAAARHRRHPARSHAGSAHGRESPRQRSKARAIRSPTCICGGLGPAISAPSSRSRPTGDARGGALPAATGQIRRPVPCHRGGPALPFGIPAERPIAEL